MKPIFADKAPKKNGYQSDDDNIRYKLNTEYFNNINKSPKNKNTVKVEKLSNDDDDNIRYKFPTVILNRTKLPDQKPKPKQKIKVNFWSNKQSVNRLNNNSIKQKSNRRHTVGATAEDTTAKPKHSAVKVRKRVSFLPSPIFSDNHVPMVTVPDDLTIQLNEEEANDLADDLNLAFVNSGNNDSPKRKPKNINDANQPGGKRKRSVEDLDTRAQGNENELEFFSKYVVQKLRRMETNQRIYSENLINTVLMLGQLGKLNGKSKIAEA